MGRIRIHEHGYDGRPALKDREWVCGYSRISGRGQSDKWGLESQRRSIFEYCKKNNYNLTNIYTDVVSGVESSLQDRKGFWEMVEYARKGGFKKIVVADISRVYREVSAAIQVKKIFRELGLEIISINQSSYSIYNDDNPSDFLMNQILDAIAHMDRLITVNRLRVAREIKASQGKLWGGGIATGFATEKSELVIEPEMMKVVKYIFKLHRKKISFYKISKFLNEQNIKGQRGGQWTPTSVKRLIRNRIFKGYLRYGDKYYKSQLGKIT